MKRTSYSQLQADERLTISSMKQRGLGLRESSEFNNSLAGSIVSVQ